MHHNPAFGNNPGMQTLALDLLDEAFVFCDLIHMAMRVLSEDERDALHAGVDQVSERILKVKDIMKERASS
ncbi:hypothetical protein [Paracoccus sp. (in: a-proteobacteria)]|uniref:hypothetical protein n=1 Tax=Paracoccus sp. TaxID=267 RepID=UPI002AFDCF4A|nr:hypothetical protein [Paracoccus sp. (in: a-proteobacteria)]